jgi:riboflavin kinase/FMN adenylyltransferase
MTRSLSPPQTLITFGKFDGVHRGHQAILKRCIELAQSKGLVSLALILDPEIRSLAKNRPDAVNTEISDNVNTPTSSNLNASNQLTTLHQRQRLIGRLGIDSIVTQKLNRRFKAISGSQFLCEILQKRLNASVLVLGPNQRFGSDLVSFSDSVPNLASDLVNTSDQSLRSLPLELAQIDQLETVDGKIISSHAIREAVGQADFNLANRMLGRNFSLRGLVTQGKRRGSQIGFPTANLTEIETLIPPPGVYHCLAKVRNQFLPAAVSIGYNQTFGANSSLTVEAHLIQNSGLLKSTSSDNSAQLNTNSNVTNRKLNLYGKYLTLEFIRLLRPMEKFESVDALKTQIAHDVDEILKSEKK